MTTIEKQGKTVAIFGLTVPAYSEFTLVNVLIEKGASVRISGYRDGVAFDRTFRVGERAEYDSYNFSYVSEITSIGEKRIAFGKERRSLTLAEFIRRNWDFSEAAIAERRAAWSD